MEKKHLVVVTRGYPYNTEELSFLTQELEVLKEYYHILIIAKFTVEERSPEDCEYPYVACVNKFSLPSALFFLARTFLDIRVWKEMWILISKRRFTFGGIRHVVSECFFSKNFEKTLKRCIRDIPKEEEIVFYSYWYDYSLLALTKLKRSNSKLITRMHGFDLYNERCPWGCQCFKEQLEEKIDRIVFISEYGKDYYRKNFAKPETNASKLVVNYLGVRQQEYMSYQAHDELILVSCSSLIPLKRVDKIIEALSLIDDISITWTHIGDGSSKESILEYAHALLDHKDNVRYIFTGYLESKDVMEYYRNNYFDYYILLSDTEGLPVSIMEAMSFGVPAIASDVGGVGEIVDAENGQLIRNTENAEEVALALRRLYALSKDEVYNMRKHAFETWEHEFNARTNAGKLVAMLDEI